MCEERSSEMDLLKFAFQNLDRKKSRTFLTVLSISIGVASVILISSIGAIGTQTVNQEINSLGIGALTVSIDGLTGSDVQLNEEHLDFLQSRPQIVEAVPILTEKAKIEMRGLSADGMIWGVDAGEKQIFHLDIQYGRLFRKEDIRSCKKVCLVDETMAQAFYHRENITGKEMDIILDGRRESFEIVGVVSSGGNLLQSFMGEYVPSFVYLPYSSMQQVFGKSGFDQIALQLDNEEEVEAFSEQIITQLEEREGKSGIFQTQNIAMQKEKLNNIMQIVSQILAVIAGISMVVAGLGIMSVMLAAVSERTREIGIKKSIGATKGMIVREFLIEAFVLSLLGSILGTAVGLGIFWIGCQVIHMDFLLESGSICSTIVFAVIIGIVFGSYPSLKAANLKPVEALRQDG